MEPIIDLRNKQHGRVSAEPFPATPPASPMLPLRPRSEASQPSLDSTSRRGEPGLTPPTPQEEEPLPAHLRAAAPQEMLLSWEAPEFIKYAKDAKTWTRGVLLFFGAIAVVFLVSKNILGALLMAICGFTLALYAVKEPRVMAFGISARGLCIGEKIHPFETLQSFWIFYDPPEVKELSIQTKNFFGTYLKVPLGSMNPIEVRKTLLTFLPEIEQKESNFDVIARRLRF